MSFSSFCSICLFHWFCNGDSVLMCPSTCPGPDCIGLTDIQLRDKYIHLCFLSVVVKDTIHPVCPYYFFCVVCNSSYNFLMHTIYCWSFLLSLPLNRHCSSEVISHIKSTEMTEFTLLFNFLQKWLSMSWNKSKEHQNHMSILWKKYAFPTLSLSCFPFYTCVVYFRRQWPMMMCISTSLRKSGICWILPRRISIKM